jgi:hypothetical protein
MPTGVKGYFHEIAKFGRTINIGVYVCIYLKSEKSFLRVIWTKLSGFTLAQAIMPGSAKSCHVHTMTYVHKGEKSMYAGRRP